MKDFFLIFRFLFIKEQKTVLDECGTDWGYGQDKMSLSVLWRTFWLLFFIPFRLRWMVPTRNGEILFEYRTDEFDVCLEVTKKGYELMCVSFFKEKTIWLSCTPNEENLRFFDVIKWTNRYYKNYIGGSRW